MRSLKLIRQKIFRKAMSLLVMGIFVLQTSLPCFAQSVLGLPVPGAMVAPSAGYVPALIRGITLDPDNPLKFDFIIDTGNSALADNALADESTKLIKYFLASLTVPENELWVNLSPYEKNRIATESFGATEMGRDLLAQDYILKQLSATLTQPDTELGKRYWGEVNKSLVPGPWSLENTNQAPGTNHQEPSLSKVWIVPDEAVVQEYKNSAFVVKSHLKVMMEEDYEKGTVPALKGTVPFSGASENQGQSPRERGQSLIFRQLILPRIEKEVNEGKNFANLRQIYNSMILAAWYKNNLRQSLLGQVYVDKNKILGVDVDDPQIKEKIYGQYLAAFKKGVYNAIREEEDPVTGESIPRKYFSGGFMGSHMVEMVAGSTVHNGSAPDIKAEGKLVSVSSAIVENPPKAPKKRYGSWQRSVAGVIAAVQITTALGAPVESMARTGAEQSMPGSQLVSQGPDKNPGSLFIKKAGKSGGTDGRRVIFSFDDIFPARVYAPFYHRMLMPTPSGMTAEAFIQSYEFTGGKVIWTHNRAEMNRESGMGGDRVGLTRPNKDGNADIILQDLGDPRKNAEIAFHEGIHALALERGSEEFYLKLRENIKFFGTIEVHSAFEKLEEFFRFYYTDWGGLLYDFMNGYLDGDTVKADIAKYVLPSKSEPDIQPGNQRILPERIYSSQDLISEGDYHRLMGLLEIPAGQLTADQKAFINALIKARMRPYPQSFVATEIIAYFGSVTLFPLTDDARPSQKDIYQRFQPITEWAKSRPEVRQMIQRTFRNMGLPNPDSWAPYPVNVSEVLNQIDVLLGRLRTDNPQIARQIISGPLFDAYRDLELRKNEVASLRGSEYLPAFRRFLTDALWKSEAEQSIYSKWSFDIEHGHSKQSIFSDNLFWDNLFNEGYVKSGERGYITDIETLIKIISVQNGRITSENLAAFKKLSPSQSFSGREVKDFAAYSFGTVILRFKGNHPDSLQALENKTDVYMVLEYYIRDSSLLEMIRKNMGISRFEEENWKDHKNPVTSVSQKDNVGGINFDPALLNLQIKRDPSGRPLPVIQQPIGSMDIQGFYPLIIEIKPVNNLPLLLSSKK